MDFTSDCRAWIWPSSGLLCRMDFPGLGFLSGFQVWAGWGLLVVASFICIGFWTVRSLHSCAGQPSKRPQRRLLQPRQIGLIGGTLSRLVFVACTHGAMAPLAPKSAAETARAVLRAEGQLVADRAVRKQTKDNRAVVVRVWKLVGG